MQSDWEMFAKIERETRQSRYSGEMPLGVRLRWFVLSLFEPQIQALITERILAYDRHNSSGDATALKGRPVRPCERQDQNADAQISNRSPI